MDNQPFSCLDAFSSPAPLAPFIASDYPAGALECSMPSRVFVILYCSDHVHEEGNFPSGYGGWKIVPKGACGG